MKDNIMKKSMLVLGAGSWGTALAVHLAFYGHKVKLWSWDKKHVKQMQDDRSNQLYLPEVEFPKNVIVIENWHNIIGECDHVLVAVPSSGFASIMHELAPKIKQSQGVLWATKGFCHDSYRFLHQIALDILPKNTPLGLLTGPSFANEVAKFMPTAVVIASNDEEFAKQMQGIFSSPTFRTYISNDLIGVQVGGAVKNVLAIATGISDGLGFGANARSGLITRGLAEIQRLGVALGANIETLMGLSGVGDLVLTCTDNQSRNRRFGLLLGSGESQKIALEKIGQVVEGVPTTLSVHNIAKKHHVEMPIVEQMYKLLYCDLSPKEAVKNLMSRKSKSERDS